MLTIPFEQGQIIAKGNDFFLEISDENEPKLYYIHPWDKERLKLQKQDNKVKIDALGQLFHYQQPDRRNHVVYHGWVHPGTLTLAQPHHP